VIKSSVCQLVLLGCDQVERKPVGLAKLNNIGRKRVVWWRTRTFGCVALEPEWFCERKALPTYFIVVLQEDLRYPCSLIYYSSIIATPTLCGIMLLEKQCETTQGHSCNIIANYCCQLIFIVASFLLPHLCAIMLLEPV
jgi:hypothetical protein